jgi:hypothetical protein
VIRVSGSDGVHFSGSYSLTSAGKTEKHNIEGVVPAEYPTSGTAISAIVAKRDEAGSLMIEIRRNGTVVKVAGTNGRGSAVAVATN